MHIFPLMEQRDMDSCADLECKMRVQLFPVPLRIVERKIGGGRPAAQMLMGADANAKEGRVRKEKWLEASR